jgi:VanZ family protein
MMTQRSPTFDLNLIKKWLPVVLWLALIFYFSTDQFSSSNTSQIVGPVLDWLLPGIAVDSIYWVHSLLRKLGHWSEYMVFAVLLVRALRDTRADWKLHHTALSIMFVFFYAAGDEFHQSFVPSRTANVNDVLIDLFGGICGILWMILRQERSRKDARERIQEAR